jgi:hypothetical protein
VYFNHFLAPNAKLSGQVPPALSLTLRKRLRGTWSASG